MSDGQVSNSVPWSAGQGQQDDQDPRRQAVDLVLAIALAAATVGIAAHLFQALGDSAPEGPSSWLWTETVPLLAVYVLLLALTFMRRLGFAVRATGLLLVGYGAGIYSLAAAGPVGGGTLLLLCLPAVGLLILGVRSGVVMAGASLLIYAVLTLLAAGGWLAAGPTAGDNSVDLGLWLSQGILFVPVLSALIGLQAFLTRAETNASTELRQTARELRRANRDLEHRREQLDWRVRLLDATATITRDLVASRDGQELLRRAVTLAVERLEFDWAAIYLADDRPEGSDRAWEALGEGGGWSASAGVQLRGGRRVWLAARHGTGDDGGQARLPGAVGQALAREAPAVRPLPAGGPAGYELAIPLSLATASAHPAADALPARLEDQVQGGGRIIGVLALRSSAGGQVGKPASPAGMDVAEVGPALQAMAGQMALTLEHLHHLSETRASLHELEARYRHYAGEAWQAPGGRKLQPARSWRAPGAPLEGQPASLDWEALFAEARATGEPATHLDPEQDAYLIAVPVKLRDVPIGVVGFHRGASMGPWLPEQVASVQAVAERVALAAENLRLLDATQRRAARDRLLAKVTAHMRQSLDIDAVLQAGVREMRQALGIPEVELWLDVPEVRGPEIAATASQEGEVAG